MTKSNGKPKTPGVVTLTIIANLETGKTHVDHPGDLILAQQMLAQAMNGVAAKMAAERAEAEATKIQIAPASVINRLPPPSGVKSAR